MTRRALCSLLFVAGLLASTAEAFAQANWPTRTINIVSPFAAGGPADGLTRVFAAAMERNLHQTVVVTNVGGAGGMIGARQVAGAAPDGYTLLMHHIGMATAPALFRDLQFDPIGGFAPVGLAGEQPMVLIAGKQFPAQNINELVALVRRRGEAVTMASAGLGSGTHLCATLFEIAAGVKVTMVQYRGSGPAYADVIAGRVDLMCDGTGAAVPQTKAGAVNAFLVTGARRIESLPDVPSSTEAGLDRLAAMTIWYGLFAPAGTAQPVIDRLSQALQAAGRDPEVIARMRSWDTAIFEQAQATPGGLRQLLANSTTLWRDALRAAGVEPQ
ncbi:tripartite tricarboxylate transporter substrate binding protein [Roseomonas sp. AR75]|uniref:Bug family tripartite tricarboxylate transporter substrate binding protein n=1 Tax=Roseomonas sp. AR75 TaxID=2562311 RepID=UPI0010BF82F4|nr:tripartite tricarboxylate transporter substrate-binding protein [Roseomonas sp. AR75]